MKHIPIGFVVLAMLVTPALMPKPLGAPAMAQQKTKKIDLSGQKGNVRRRLPRGKKGCGKAVQRYIDASGHSAYASTPMRAFGASNFICHVAYDFPTTEQAEAAALRGCIASTKKWKNAYGGKCEIHASK